MSLPDLLGFTNGYGGLESIRIHDGLPVLLDRHLERLRHTCRFLGLDDAFETSALKHEIADLTEKSGHNGRLNLYASAVSWRSRQIKLVLRLRPLPDTRPLTLTVFTEETERSAVFAHKTMATAMHWAPFALPAADHDVLKVSPGGHLLETRFATVFLCDDHGHWATPGDVSIVNGITRAWLLTHLPHPVAEKPLTLADLETAKEIFVCNAIRGIWPVTGVEGYPGLCSGQETDRVMTFYQACLKQGFAHHP